MSITNRDVVTMVLGTLVDFQDQVMAIDRLLLTLLERTSPHMVGHTEGGRTVRISLPRGTELHERDVLAVDGNVAIVVAAATENLIVITPRDALEWGIVGYQVGNLHRQVRFTDEAVLTPADSEVAKLLDRLGIPHDRVMAPFVGKQYAPPAQGANTTTKD